MKKFSKLKRIGHRNNQGMLEQGEILVKEKLDGANFRWTITEDGEVVCGSRNVEYTDEDDVDSRFKSAIEYVEDKFDNLGTHSTYFPRYTFFGENMVKHSLEYKWEETPQVIGFDVYDHEENEYLSVDDAHDLFATLGFETAKIVARMPAEDFDPEEFDAAQESEYRDGAGEGVVIINTGMEENDRSGFSTRAKMLTEEFKEKHDKSMGDGSKADEEPEGHNELIQSYCTDARIKKHIHKMRDEGRELSMELMANEDGSTGLPIRVAEDIVEEEYDSIVRMDDPVSFKKFRSAVATQCVSRLRAMMQGEAQ